MGDMIPSHHAWSEPSSVCSIVTREDMPMRPFLNASNTSGRYSGLTVATQFHFAISSVSFMPCSSLPPLFMNISLPALSNTLIQTGVDSTICLYWASSCSVTDLSGKLFAVLFMVEKLGYSLLFFLLYHICLTSTIVVYFIAKAVFFPYNTEVF